MNYAELLAAKLPSAKSFGCEPVGIMPSLFDHQTHCVDFAVRAGRAGIYLDTGLGKTGIELGFADAIMRAANVRRPLILCPLAVAQQIKREAMKLGGFDATIIRDQSQAVDGINICNYDRLDKLDPSTFDAIILDESSVLKSYTGKTTRALIDSFQHCRWRLAATATPAPNDHMEIGQQCEFLGVMQSSEMLMRWFISDQTSMGTYRLKHHGERDFWDWMASWARMASLPSDLGFDDSRFVLPPLLVEHIQTDADVKPLAGTMFLQNVSATEIHGLKRQTAEGRAEVICERVNAEPNEPWIVWCDTNYEADVLTRMLPDAIEVRGSQTISQKEELLESFSSGQSRVLITKPSVCGYGMNWQHCARVAFVGQSFSYESYYQAVRRCWRFGQTRPVQVIIAIASGEDQIRRIIEHKAGAHSTMKRNMREAMARTMGLGPRVINGYEPNHNGRLPIWISK